ncbi:hypothetical protein WL27_26195 [Burkholderia multivorans]|nr:hypothetical protein WL27_26195 [Burkholderia multivorans]
MQAVRKNYNLIMTFAQKGTGAYLSDVQVVIQDATGKEIMRAMSEGPFFFAKLPSGRYKVIADYLNSTQTLTANIHGHKSVDLYLYWINE